MRVALSGSSRPRAGRSVKNSKRGALLVEAALAVGIAVSLVGLSISISREQEARSNAILLGNEKRALLEASIAFIDDNKTDVLNALYQSAVTTSLARRVFTVADLQAAGQIPAGVTLGTSLQRDFGQQYRLVARLVAQNATGIPAPTQTRANIDPLNIGRIDPRFLDGDIANGELGIEAVLFSTGGTPIPPGTATRIMTATGMLNAGFMYQQELSRSPGNIINFNAAGFRSIAGFSGATLPLGRFASVVSFGSSGTFGGPGAPDLRDTFARCSGINPASPVFIPCLNANRSTVFGNLDFTPSDGNGDGTLDTFPAITGATRLLCIQDIEGPAAAVDRDVFLIDCATTRVNGVLDVTGDEIRFNNDTLVSERTIGGETVDVLESDRVALRLPSGAERDLGENLFSSVRVAARGTIPVQECPSRNLAGQPLLPVAEAQVTAVIDPWGRAISGSLATVERGNLTGVNWTPSATGTRWMARVRYTLSADFCQSTFASPISIRDTYTNADNLASNSTFFAGTQRPNVPAGRCGNASTPAGTPDGIADIYEMFPMGPPPAPANFGVATIILSCRP